MSFFKDLKEDIAQSVNELTESLDEGLENGQSEEAVKDYKDEKVKANSPDADETVEIKSDFPVEEKEAADLEALTNSDDLEEPGAVDGADAGEVLPESEAEEKDSSADILADIVPEETEENVEAENVEEDNIEELVKEEPVMSEEMNQVIDSVEEDSPEVTVITKGTTINGGIKSDTSLVVKGTIEGDVECQGKLTITGRVAGNTIASEIYVNTPRLEGDINSKGIVKIDVGTVVIGNVNCTSVVVAGAVKGDIEVNGPVVVDSTAVVKGSIKAKSIQINSGAVIDGHCSLQFADVDLDSFFE